MYGLFGKRRKYSFRKPYRSYKKFSFSRVSKFSSWSPHRNRYIRMGTAGYANNNKGITWGQPTFNYHGGSHWRPRQSSSKPPGQWGYTTDQYKKLHPSWKDAGDWYRANNPNLSPSERAEARKRWKSDVQKSAYKWGYHHGEDQMKGVKNPGRVKVRDYNKQKMITDQLHKLDEEGDDEFLTNAPVSSEIISTAGKIKGAVEDLKDGIEDAKKAYDAARDGDVQGAMQGASEAIDKIKSAGNV